MSSLLPKLATFRILIIGTLVTIGCGSGAHKVPASNSSQQLDVCGLPMIADRTLLGASNPATIHPRDGDTVRVVGRAIYNPTYFALRWPCHPPLSRFVEFVSPAAACVPEGKIVVMEGRARVELDNSGMVADGPSFYVDDYKLLAVTDEKTVCGVER